MKLSNYVSLAEVTKSDTATRKGIDNTPTAEHLENLKTICTEVFDKVREHFGVPIYISSGYRSAALNKAIGGSKLRRTIILVGP
jgi:zinc D-Ala-D-Ala carboxypeptidase